MDEELYNAVAVKKDVKIRSRFTKGELKFIEDNKKKPPNYTWHHHQEVGKMQLVDRVKHKDTDHTGGYALWGKGQLKGGNNN
jgi:hypothetical protein